MARKVTGSSNYGYFNKVSVTSTTFAAVNPDIVINLNYALSGLIIANEGSGATSVVEGSYDGLNVHFETDPTKSSSILTYPNRQVSTIYLRVKSGSTPGITIRVEAW